MSLLEEAMEECTMLDKTTTDDGYGGVNTVYVDGATFYAAIPIDNSMQARVAEKDGVTALYTVTTKKNVNLQFHEEYIIVANNYNSQRRQYEQTIDHYHSQCIFYSK